MNSLTMTYAWIGVLVFFAIMGFLLLRYAKSTLSEYSDHYCDDCEEVTRHMQLVKGGSKFCCTCGESPEKGDDHVRS